MRPFSNAVLGYPKKSWLLSFKGTLEFGFGLLKVNFSIKMNKGNPLLVYSRVV